MYVAPLSSIYEGEKGHCFARSFGDGESGRHEYHVINRFPALVEALRPPVRARSDGEVNFSKGVITLKDKSVAAEKKRMRLSRYAKPLDTGNNVKNNEMRAQIRTDVSACL